MKRLLFVFCICLWLLSSCTRGGFEITGNVEGFQDGRVFLLVSTGQSWDTLAAVDMRGNKFEIKGERKEVVFATLLFDKQKSVEFMLENGHFSVSGSKENLQVRGGDAQSLLERFQQFSQEAAKTEADLEEKYYRAQEENDEKLQEQILEDIDNVILDMHAKENELITMNPDSYVSGYIVYKTLEILSVENFMLVSLRAHATYECLRNKFMLLGETGKNTTYGKLVSEYIVARERVAEGCIAPNFEVETPDGTKITLYEMKGKVKLIDFWASWCGPCRLENPRVLSVFNKYHDRGLTILGISLDDNKEKWMKAIQEDQLPWVHGSDLKGWNSTPAQLFKVRAIPATILLDINNRIVARDLRGEELENKIVELLNKE